MLRHVFVSPVVIGYDFARREFLIIEIDRRIGLSGLVIGQGLTGSGGAHRGDGGIGRTCILMLKGLATGNGIVYLPISMVSLP
jgi:hypothetical protein